MIIVVGSINLDLIVRLDRLPSPGETLQGTRFDKAPGGKGANQALAAARAGARVRMIGAVGNDAFAGEALSLLRAGGLDLSGVAVSTAPTGTALIFVGADGENMIALVAGANSEVHPADLGKAELKNGDVLLLQQEIPPETVEAALNMAQDAGALSVLNIAPYRDESGRCLTKADFIVANETEFDQCCRTIGIEGSDVKRRMRSFVSRTGGTIIVTLGPDGVLAATPDNFLEGPAMDIQPVDTVGAGDTFCGYLAAGLSMDLSLEKVLARAAAAGSLACLKAGAQPSIPLASEVDAALSRRAR